eukprot:3875088-Lingulodinium_polyedra.AAC.1
MEAIGARLCAVMASRAASMTTAVGPVLNRSLRPPLAQGAKLPPRIPVAGCWATGRWGAARA